MYQYTLKHAPEMPLRVLVNILYAFSEMASGQSVLQSYRELYSHCMVTVAVHLRESKELTEKDLVGITVAYSRSQSFNADFLKVLDQVAEV